MTALDLLTTHWALIGLGLICLLAAFLAGFGAGRAWVDAGADQPGSRRQSGRDYIAETWAVRRLTPRECERLQGFPDDWTLVPWRGKPAADGGQCDALDRRTDRSGGTDLL